MTRRARWFQAAGLFVVLWSLTTHGKPSVSGDEPHYLMVAESLVADGDLDLRNNYANGSGRWFGTEESDPGLHAVPNRWGALWSSHDIGTPVSLLPVYAAVTRLAARAPEQTLARFRQTRGLFAYSLLGVFLILLTVCGISLLTSGLARTVPAWQALSVGTALALAPPVLGYSFVVFPEPLAFVIVCAVVWLICLRRDELSPSRVGLVLLAVGSMAWLHRKYSPLILGLGWLMVARQRPWFRGTSRRERWIFAAAFVLPHAGFYLWSLWAWGSVGGAQLLHRIPFDISILPEGAVGLLIDREHGLVASAPVYLILPACVALSWRESRAHVATALLLYLPMAAFIDWRGGYAPLARYVMPLTPLLALPLARGLAFPAIRRTAIGLGALQLAFSAGAWQYPRRLWPKFDGLNQMTEPIPIAGPAYDHWLPSFANGPDFAHAILTMASIAAVSYALIRLARGATRPKQSHVT